VDKFPGARCAAGKLQSSSSQTPGSPPFFVGLQDRSWTHRVPGKLLSRELWRMAELRQIFFARGLDRTRKRHYITGAAGAAGIRKE